MLNKRYSIKIMVIAVMVAIMVVPLSAFANGPRVYLKEAESTGNVMKVNVLAENVTDLYGMEFQIKYDPSVMAVKDTNAEEEGVQIQPGDFLPVDKGFVVANQANAAEGTITLAVTLLNPAPAVSGSGVLAQLSFDVLNDQATALDISQLNLVSGDMNEIVAQTEGLNLGTESSGTMMYLIIGGAAGVVALLIATGGFMMMGRQQQSKTVAPRQRVVKQSKLSA